VAKSSIVVKALLEFQASLFGEGLEGS